MSSSNLLTFKEVFRDFIKLSYVQGKRSNRLRDILVSELSIIRIDSSGCTLYKLESGTSFKIPWEWTDIFYSFSINSGDAMNIIGNRLNEDSDDIEVFGCLFYKFIVDIFNSPNKISNSFLFYDRLNEITDLKTNSFIKWSEKELNISLRPFELFTINGTMTI